MKKYSELSSDLQNKICKDTLRPMAAQIYGHLYQVEAERGNQWLNDISVIKSLAKQAVTAASAICAELNNMYGSQFDELYETESSPNKLFTVTYCYGQEVYSAPSAEELLDHLNKSNWCREKLDLSDIKEVSLKEGINFIGGHVE